MEHKTTIQRKDKDILQMPTGPACNNNCIFCMERGDFEKKYNLLPAEEIKVLLEKEKDVKRIIFSFGEPTLNPYLRDYIKLAKEIGYKEILLVSNGRMFKYKQFIISLLKAGLTGIIVSIHGHNPKVHDSLTRTPGSFAQTFSGLNNLCSLRSKFKFDFFINVTLTKSNVPYLSNLLQLLISLKVDSINFNLAEPRGNALKYFEEVVPDYSYAASKFCDALEQTSLAERKRNINPKISICGIPPCLFEAKFIDYLGWQSKNHIYSLANNLKKKLNIQLEKIIGLPEDRKIKPDSCKQCIGYGQCEGVWKEYIIKKGFKEFKPFIK